MNPILNPTAETSLLASLRRWVSPADALLVAAVWLIVLARLIAL